MAIVPSLPSLSWSVSLSVARSIGWEISCASQTSHSNAGGQEEREKEANKHILSDYSFVVEDSSERNVAECVNKNNLCSSRRIQTNEEVTGSNENHLVFPLSFGKTDMD